MSKTLALDFGCVLRTTRALAARALPITAFHATESLKANADPGSLATSEPAREYPLPPGVTGSANRKVLQRHCPTGARVQRNVYPGLGHNPVVYGSLRDQLDWIAACFAGEPAPSNCPAPWAFKG